MIVAYLCDILLQNKAVLRHLENSSELIHNCKKERIQNDVKIRKLRMVLARRAVASACEGGEEKPATAEETPPPPPLIEEEEDKLSMEELKSKMSHLQNTNEKLKKQMQLNFKNIRTPCIGQDRYRRRYWNLPHSGGCFVEGGISSEFEDLKQLVKLKFEKNTLNNEDEDENEENVAPPAPPPPPTAKVEGEGDPLLPPPPVGVAPFVLQVPPPCIKIFSFGKDSLCSGKRPLSDRIKKPGPTDDELLVKKIKKQLWNGYFYLDDVDDFSATLVENGLREKDLKSALQSVEIKKKVPKFEDTENMEGEEFYDIGVDPDLVYRIHLGLIETLEGLEVGFLIISLLL